ncbi:hypothetical protein [Nocardioides sp. SYSU D00038]|nr:hypothetical protein [Nocardioides sp. SYSU D00038]
MDLYRKIAIAVAAGTASVALIGVSAPAQAAPAAPTVADLR